MKTHYSNTHVREYLKVHYSATFRKNNRDHFYNFRNRQSIGVPIAKETFTDEEIMAMFSGKTELPSSAEMLRFTTFISQQLNDSL